MSVNISINVSGTEQPWADVLTLDKDSVTPGGQFIVLHLTRDCSVILNGTDQGAASSARAIAAVLTGAAEAIEARVAPVLPMESFAEMDDRIAREMAREEA